MFDANVFKIMFENYINLYNSNLLDICILISVYIILKYSILFFLRYFSFVIMKK